MLASGSGVLLLFHASACASCCTPKGHSVTLKVYSTLPPPRLKPEKGRFAREVQALIEMGSWAGLGVDAPTKPTGLGFELFSPPDEK